MRHAMDIAFTETDGQVLAPSGYIPIDEVEDVTDWTDADVEPCAPWWFRGEESEEPTELADVDIESKPIAVFCYDGRHEPYVEYIEEPKAVETLTYGSGQMVFLQPKLGRKNVLKTFGGDFNNLWDIFDFRCCKNGRVKKNHKDQWKPWRADLRRRAKYEDLLTRGVFDA